MIQRFFATPRPPATQRSCSLDGCDVIVTSQRLLVPSWIGPVEIWLCQEHAAQLQRVRQAVAKQGEELRRQVEEQAEQAKLDQDIDE